MRSDMLELPGELRQEIICLAAILRIADALDSSRSGCLSVTRCKIKNEFLQIYYGEKQESELEKFFLSQKSRLFLEVVGLQVQLVKEK